MSINTAPVPHRPKNKTLAAWLAFLGGGFGLHRFYLHGFNDLWAWLHPVPTALGLWGVDRMLTYGQNDALSWVLIPLLGFSVAIACLTAIVYALMDAPKWNRRYNAGFTDDHPAGHTQWLTVAAVVFALMLGTIGLMSGLAFSFQRYFEYQVEEALKISR
ncbi:MAG: hypothetical protein RL323_1106 [Pseudomonadota bacterium]|jgi:hypothetical protein